MRFRRAKSEPEQVLDAVSDSIAERIGAHRGALLKAALIAGGAAALSAASAAISSLRRRTEASS